MHRLIPAPVLYALLLSAPALAESPPEMAMTTPVPEGVATPNTLETSIGTLTSVDGVPDAATTQRVFDELDKQRATQAFMAALPLASTNAMERGLRTFGEPNKTAILFDKLMDSKALWLTPNTTSVYMVMWLEVGDEPMVIETPPDVLGIIDDAFFHYVTDFGRLGADKNAGGKFLIVPPGYEGEIPKGYHVARTATHGNWVIWRGFQKNGSPAPAIATTKETYKVYPLSQKDDPPAMTFVNASGVEHSTLHRMDYGYWEEVNQVIQEEPLEGLNPETRGLLAAIGIEKGKPFAPDDRMKAILEDAAKIGSVMARALTANPRDERAYLYPGKRKWTNPLFERRYDFLIDGATNLDARTYMHFYATGITPAMALKFVGKGSQYGIAYLDSDGNAFDGAKTYKLHLPKDVPAQDFWSFTIYDNQTRSMLQTDDPFPGIDSNRRGLKQNKDGSWDVYFGPTAPKGMKKNWVQTVPGKGWNTIMRLYGPLDPFYDQTWIPGDIELVD